MFSRKSLGLVWKNKNLTQLKHTLIIKRNKHKKLKPGLAASYDIRTGNGVGLFWFWNFINLSVI